MRGVVMLIFFYDDTRRRVAKCHSCTPQKCSTLSYMRIDFVTPAESARGNGFSRVDKTARNSAHTADVRATQHHTKTKGLS